MEKEYVKELDRAYLMFEGSPFDEEEYVLQMAMRGRLPGILPLSVFAKDGKKYLRADVTACTSITSRYQNTALTGGDLRRILSAIRNTAARMPSLLMSVQDLHLDPESIFLGGGGDEILLTYVPHCSDQEPDTVRLLSEFLLKKTDHSDPGATQLAYALFDRVSAESYDLPGILSDLLKEDMSHTASDSGGYRSHAASDSGGYRDHAASDSGGYRDHAASDSGGYRDHTASDSGGYRSRAASDSGESVFEAFPRANGKKLSPPAGRGSGKNRTRQAAGRSGAFSGNRKRRHRHSLSLRSILPTAIILPCACVLVVVFRMDLSQILGMGFLCGALIWIIHSSLEKSAGEGKNVWFDDGEDPESDDSFYQSLRDELYAEDQQSLYGGLSAQRQQPLHGGLSAQRQQPSRGGLFSEDQQSLYGGGPESMPHLHQGYASDGFRHATDAGVPEERTTLLQRRSPALVSLKKDCCPDITLDREYLILGKSRSQSDITLPGNTVSRKHARIERRMDGYYVTDLFSTNGTFLDGHRLEGGQAVALKDGALLTIASLPYRVVIPAANHP